LRRWVTLSETRRLRDIADRRSWPRGVGRGVSISNNLLLLALFAVFLGHFQGFIRLVTTID
jgi:hypothetical protein